MGQGTRAVRDNNDEVEVEVRVMRMRSSYQHITLNNQIKRQGTTTTTTTTKTTNTTRQHPTLCATILCI